MKSISGKIMKAILIGLSLIVVLMTATSIVVVNRISENDSEMLMTQECEKELLKFNNEFTLLEHSVTTIAEFVAEQEKECASEDELLSDEFCEKVQALTISIANRTDGAMAVYFRYDPELTGNGTGGFFWSRSSDEEEFSYEAPTDILQYDADDREHVGWFYEPKESRQPMWMSPYYNQNLNVFMISYVIPYYTESGDFLGVIGMDIDFRKIVGLTSEVSLYETGSACIVDLSGSCRYLMGEDGTVVTDTLSAAEISQPGMDAAVGETVDAPVVIRENGKRLMLCAGTLANGMKLLLLVPVMEINAQRNQMLLIFALIMAAALLCTILFILRFTNRIVHPLQVLTRITGNYAKGNWDETYVTETGDEIQQLSESISVMAETTKSYIEKINRNAMTDALTGLKNKNCYLSWIQQYQKGKIPIYAVAVFDINYLKKVNDQFGHEAGDEIIKRGGMYICNVFQHSPVFRTGGDEYAAILTNRDYENREALYEQFEQGFRDIAPAAEGIPFSISYGAADFPADGTDYDAVYRCADERMYEFKKKAKAVRE